MKMPRQKQSGFQQKLIQWYSQNKRDLPWRNTRSAYAIWVSEIMLQQTRVETVIPYYERFLARFPDMCSLAQADLQEVLKSWEGLGYYSRARNLYRAAKIICEKYDGRFPKKLKDIVRLPGVGKYTAGAICSIAFNQAVPVVDGNVIRVLSRYFELDLDIQSLKNKRTFWQLAEQLVPEKAPGVFNQAIMELGATICLPRKPKCRDCPFYQNCLARQKKRQDELPVRRKKAPVPHYVIGAGIIWKDDKILITKRRENGLLGGLWEFPGGKQEDGETIEQCIGREIKEELGIQVKVLHHYATVKHAYSHFRITLIVHDCRWLEGEPRCKACSAFRWVKLDELESFPFPRANKRIIEKLCE